MEKEAGGGGLDNRRYPYNLKGVRGERPNYAPQGAWGRHPVTGAGMANFLVTQPDASSAWRPKRAIVAITTKICLPIALASIPRP